MLLTMQEAADWQDILMMNSPDNDLTDDDELSDELLADDDDEDFDDMAEDRDDLNEIRVGDDLGEPDPEDDDHLPDEELQ